MGNLESGIKENTKWIGYGYNALNSDYISSKNVIGPLLNVNESHISIENVSDSNIIKESGSSLIEMIKKINASAKFGVDLLLFGGSFSQEFYRETKTSELNAFTRIMGMHIRQRRFLKGGISKAKELLNPRFAADLDGNMPPIEIFKTYGTHLIVDLFAGGRVIADFKTEKTISETTERVKEKLDASFDLVFKGNVNADVTRIIAEVEKGTKSTIKTVGGAAYEGIGFASFPQANKNWVNSLAPDNYDICDLPDGTNSFIPLWMLCTNIFRQEALEKALAAESVRFNNDLLNSELFVVDYRFVSNSSESVAKQSCPDGFTMIGKNLNEGTKGKKIYLCYKLGPRENAYTNFFIERSSKGLKDGIYNAKHAGYDVEYFRNGVDLNSGAGGDFIYMCGTKDKRFNPVKRLNVVYGNEDNKDWTSLRWSGASGNNSVAADCNKGANGKYIFILQSNVYYHGAIDSDSSSAKWYGGIGGYDLRSPADQAFAFDYNSNGNLDHICLYRPGSGAFFIIKRGGTTFAPVYAQGADGNGIGGYDLRRPQDRAFAFDYNSSGKLDHICLYRPGYGAFFIIKREGTTFKPVYSQGEPGNGIGGFDLLSTTDQAFAYDYNGSGKLDHLVLYRPGPGAIFILKNVSGRFSPVVASTFLWPIC